MLEKLINLSIFNKRERKVWLYFQLKIGNKGDIISL